VSAPSPVTDRRHRKSSTAKYANYAKMIGNSVRVFRVVRGQNLRVESQQDFPVKISDLLVFLANRSVYSGYIIPYYLHIIPKCFYL
jgi:hypothetical protein